MKNVVLSLIFLGLIIPSFGQDRFVAGLSIPYINIPIYLDNYSRLSSNNQEVKYAKVDKMNTYTGPSIDIEYLLLQRKNINLEIAGNFTYTNDKLFTSEEDSYIIESESNFLSFAGSASLYFGLERVKFFGEIAYVDRDILQFSSGVQTIGVPGTNTHDEMVFYTKYSETYNLLRYGGGIKIDFDITDKLNNDQGSIKLKFMMDNINKLNPKKTAWGVGFDLRAWLRLTGSFFPDYPIYGQPEFKVQDPDKKAPYFQFTLGKTITR